jgi:hypothetical protein
LVESKEDEMGEERSTYGVEDKCVQVVGGNPRERGYLEELFVEKMIILKWILSSLGGRGLDSCD